MENTLFPGRPNYIGPVAGWFGLLHHDTLYEWSYNVMERVAYVLTYKPANEVEVRLYNMIYLDGLSAKRAQLYADYVSKHIQSYKDYWAKHATLAAEIWAYIQAHIPDCAWNGTELTFNIEE